MSFFDVIIYSLIQAICEFLPVSSSAHLALAPKILNITDPGIVFDLFLHFGSTLAVILYFREKIIEIFQEFFRSFKTQSIKTTKMFKIILVTFVSVLLIVLLKDRVELLRGQIQPIAFGLITFAIILSLADFIGEKKSKSFKALGFLPLVGVGIAQAIAVFPGVSRSGATISMFRFLGVKRHEAGEFSFLISIPVILIGTLYKSYKVFDGEVVSFAWSNLFLGVFLTFIFSYLVIHFFLKILRRWSLHPFSVYRITLGILLLCI